MAAQSSFRLSLLPATAFFLFAGPVPAHAAWDLARGSLSAILEPTLGYDSNLFANSEAVGDFLYGGSSFLSFERDAGLLGVAAEAGLRFERFFEESANDSTLPFANLSLVYAPDEGYADGSATLSYAAASQANQDLNTRVDSDQFAAKAAFGYLPTDKWGYRIGVSGSAEQFDDPRFADLEVIGASVDLRHLVSPKLEYAIGAAWRSSTSSGRSGGRDSDDLNLRASARGDLLSKLSGNVSAGWVQRFGGSGVDDASGVFLDVSVDWPFGEQQALTLAVGSDFDTSPNAETVERLLASLSFSQRFGEKLSQRSGVEAGSASYTGGTDREDTFIGARTAWTYRFTPSLSTILELAARSVDSDRDRSTFERFTATLRGEIKL